MSLAAGLKRRLRKALNGAGIEVHRFSPGNSHLGRLAACLREHGVDFVVDVGANEGQFGRELRTAGYAGRLLSIEPMMAAHKRLTEASRNDKAWIVHPRCAMGASPGEIELNIAGNSVSSSVLPMLAAHSNAAPQSIYLGKETVPLTTLDLVARNHLGTAQAPFLKIDTQGYEWQVLDGASHALSVARGVQLELSLIPLYEGQKLWLECISRMENLGFTLWALEPAFVNPSNGRTLQLDATFMRV
jgi:FkbM family methyltransferase